MCNALAPVPAKQRPAVVAMIKTIFAQETAQDAHAQSLKMFRRAAGFRESTGIGLARIALGKLMVLSEWHRKMVQR